MNPPLAPAASEALALAQDEAIRHGHRSAGTEHVLFALATVAGPDMADVLGALGTSCAAVRCAVRCVIPAGRPLHDQGRRLTPRAKVALDLAVRCASRSGSQYTNPRHLIYGLAAEREGLAAQVLLSQGITAAAVNRLLLPTLELAA
ncbi:Clp protease N-terminal domain-containing protein [Arthrobacter sp. 162MFSha1.1]|uniref:Clp protease N-terminal domain-containing protein n=1 Tax=Arthrobacter sp. 162MFSha1.1 TaxID=1151119 RepID=UPI000377C215|nr:Clp protease N-terminal domain-containing protein [Arthrobacter sp. 162MFSha1.1]